MKTCWIFIFLLSSAYCLAQNPKYFDNGAIRLYYEEYGIGPPLYILSGGPGEPPEYPYRQIIDSLKSSFTCVLLHQRGTGRSRNIPINESTITISNYLQDIDILRRKRGDENITLLGMSWGGLLAMNYAVHSPESVSNLILVCSAPPSYKVWDVLFDNQYARRSTSELDSMKMLHSIFSTKTEKELDSLKKANPTCKEVAAFKAFIAIHIRAMYYDRKNLLQKNFDALFAGFNFQPIPFIDKEIVQSRWDITDELKALKIPALIVYGRQDDQGESTFYLQKDCLRFSEMHVIEKCGHRIIDEKPVEFFKILMTYAKKTKG
jgi:proline iminopeptidase